MFSRHAKGRCQPLYVIKHLSVLSGFESWLVLFNVRQVFERFGFLFPLIFSNPEDHIYFIFIFL